MTEWKIDKVPLYEHVENRAGVFKYVVSYRKRYLFMRGKWNKDLEFTTLKGAKMYLRAKINNPVKTYVT